MAWQKAIEELGRRILVPAGFTARPNKRTFERLADGLRQGIELQPGTGNLKEQFTVNAYWAIHGIDKDAFSFVQRLGRFVGDGDLWFPKDEAHLDQAFLEVGQLLGEKVLPFLEKYRSVRAIIADVNAGNLSAARAFGQDPGSRAFAQGLAHLHLDQKDNVQEAIGQLKLLIADPTLSYRRDRYQRMVSDLEERLAPLPT